MNRDFCEKSRHSFCKVESFNANLLLLEQCQDVPGQKETVSII